jgi:chromosome segregation ATPase
MEATLVSIKAAKEAQKRRADEAERAREVAEQQLQRLQASMTVLQRQLEEQPQVIEKTVENPETEAELTRLREKYAATEAQLKIKTERVKVLSEEIRLHDSSNQQERYNEQIRFKWRQACDAFHLGINQAITRMVTPLDAASAFVSDDWARLASVESTLKRALEALKGLRESVSRQFVEGSVEK